MLIESKFEIQNLKVEGAGRTILKSINLSLDGNKIAGLVGKSGSGKSTIFKFCFGQLDDTQGFQSSGKVLWKGKELFHWKLPKVIPIFQDPFGSFSPYGTMENHLFEPFKIRQSVLGSKFSETKETELKRIYSYLDFFELNSNLLKRERRELSGGQLQRFSILRAILCNPEYLLLDEPVTAIDVIVQKKISDSLLRLNREQKVGMLVISHDLGFLKYICESISVLDEGSIVEEGKTKEVYANPKSTILKELKQSRNL